MSSLKAEYGSSSQFDLGGQVIIVTGGGSGIGKVYCQHLAEVGAKVVAADIIGDAAEKTVAEIRAQGFDAIAVKTDIADEESVQRMLQTTIDSYGKVDALVNNAAIMSQLKRGPWFEIDIKEWDLVMAVNLRGMFICCRAVYPYMKQQGSGKIVNISSGRVWNGTPNRLHYTTSKMGVIGFTRALAREVGDDNIAVNAITPGFTASETQLASSSESYLRKSEQLNQAKCFKRTQIPEDLIGAVMFLLSSASDYITGQTLNIDGGYIMP